MSRVEEPPAWLRPRPVRLRQLPPPDAEQIMIQGPQVCLVAGAGGALAVRLADRLRDLGCAPVFLEIALSDVGSEPGTTESHATDGITDVVESHGMPCYSARAEEEDLREALRRVQELHGEIRGVIYLHPRGPLQQKTAEPIGNAACRLLRVPFLIAKVLQPILVEAAATEAGKPWFVTVTRQDGMLGVSGTGDCDPVAGGIGGITKSLRAEWPNVFCRSIDLAVELDPDEASAAIVAELLDPNCMIAEVGYGPQGRVTLEATEEALWLSI